MSVEVTGLDRHYGRRVALVGTSLRVERGDIVGLVGPNGSGKTTLLRCIAGFLRPSAGRVRVFGRDPWRERADVMARARFAFAPPALFENLTAREHLQYLANLGRTGSGRIGHRAIEAALERVGLFDRADDRVRAFSFGMRQRLALALATLPLPELLVLDEPTDGLDPLAVLELRQVLRRLREEHGLAILLSSHLLIEIDQLVDSMLVLSEGRTVFSGTPSELCAGTERLRLQVDGVEDAVRALRSGGHDASAVDGCVELPPGALELPEAAELLGARGIRLRGFHLHRPSLEAVLLERMNASSPEVSGEVSP